jgi:hypothetical protein
MDVPIHSYTLFKMFLTYMANAKNQENNVKKKHFLTRKLQKK